MILPLTGDGGGALKRPSGVMSIWMGTRSLRFWFMKFNWPTR
jgi:hypothetical protein